MSFWTLVLAIALGVVIGGLALGLIYIIVESRNA
jgi:RsiW-degrading membrane proteinase PrsW (M82 family)